MNNESKGRELFQALQWIYIFYFFLLTVVEIMFSLLYFLLAGKADVFIFMGAGIYTGGMIVGYFGYKTALYKQKSKEMLDAFLSFR